MNVAYHRQYTFVKQSFNGWLPTHGNHANPELWTKEDQPVLPTHISYKADGNIHQTPEKQKQPETALYCLASTTACSGPSDFWARSLNIPAIFGF
jgi:hypothetical protein